MFLKCFKESRRNWFKRTIEYQERRGQQSNDKATDGWRWLTDFHETIDTAKERAKKLSKKLGYTKDNAYATKLREEKRLWYAQKTEGTNS
jgi:hypothetical protein